MRVYLYTHSLSTSPTFVMTCCIDVFIVQFALLATYEIIEDVVFIFFSKMPVRTY